MAGPITWRNVDQRPSTAEAALMFRSAGQQINQGIDAFGGLIKQAEATQANNVKVADEVGKQNYLDVLQTAKTPEELAALQADPATAALRANLSASARNATRGAEEARTTALRGQETAALAFTNARLDEAEKPIRAELDALALTNPDAARVRAQQYMTEGKLRSAAPVLKEAQAAERDNFRWDRTQLEAKNADADRLRQETVIRPVEDKLRTINLTKAEQEAQDLADSRAITVQTDTLSRAHQKAMAERKAQLAFEADNIGDSLGFTVPRNTDGSVNADRMTTWQKSEFNSYLKGVNKPTLDAVAGGDTAAIAAARAALVNSGKATVAQLAKFDAAAPAAFGTTPVAAVGNDAATIDRNSRIQDALDKDNEMQFGTVATPGNAEGLMDAALEHLGKLYTPGSWKYETARKAVAKFVMDDGIIPKGKDGKPIMDGDNKVPLRILPSKETLKQLINRTDEHWYSVGGGNPFGIGEDYVQEQLNNWKNSPERQQGAAKVGTMELEKRVRALAKPEVKK